MSSKQGILNSVNFDRAGYVSKATTLRYAKKTEINMSDVEYLFKENMLR